MHPSDRSGDGSESRLVGPSGVYIPRRTDGSSDGGTPDHCFNALDDADIRLAEALAGGQQYRPRWQRHAACHGHDVAVFFPVRGASIEHARAICSRCIVIDDCLTWSLEQPDDHGVAGGLSARQRRAERKRRGAA